MYGGQSSEGFLVDHHLLLNKQRNDTELTGFVAMININFIREKPINC